MSLIFLHGPGLAPGTRLPLPDGPIEIGRRGRPDTIALEDSSVSRSHATLMPLAAAVRLLDTSSNGTWVEGERVSAATLVDGSVLRMGDTFLLLRMGPQGVSAPVPGLEGQSD